MFKVLIEKSQGQYRFEDVDINLRFTLYPFLKNEPKDVKQIEMTRDSPNGEFLWTR
jgi:hypothetical protein